MLPRLSLLLMQAECCLYIRPVPCTNRNVVTTACSVLCCLQTEGNLVSELGFGPWRKANEDFLATFERSYQVTAATLRNVAAL
jgi:hypothetical protein